MARLRSRPQGFFRDNPKIVFPVALVLAFLLVAGIATTTQVIIGGFHPAAQSPVPHSSSHTPDPTPTPTASSGAVGVGPVVGEEDAPVNTDCSVLLSKNEYDSLLSQVLVYVTAFIDPHSPQSDATVKGLATKDYIQAHTKVIDPLTEDLNQRTALDSFQGVSCSVVSSSSVIVQTVSNMTNYEDIGGVATDQLPIVRSITMGWLKQDSTWFVNAEDG